MTLQGWTSRCETPFEWQYFTAVIICYKTEIISETPRVECYKNY